MDRPPEFELQQQLQRFATQFSDRVTQATEALEQSRRARVRDEALRKNLRYVSSAMEIAAGPFAEVNLLDMVVFVRLCRAALESHWIPELYGSDGDGLHEVFVRSEEELAELEKQSLTPEQRHKLDDLVDAWLAANPSQVRVEGVRLSDFAAQAGAAAAETIGQARGLLASVSTAARAANQALAVSERALFLVNRLPFVWRLQARLAARELFHDAGVRFARLRRALWLGGAAAAGTGAIVWWRARHR
jgi:hypothetical protein